MKIDFKFNKLEKTIIEETTGGDKTLLFMANEARKLMQPYVPELNHILVKNVSTYVEKGQGIIEYKSPYARYQFGGKVMVGNAPKSVTDRNLHYSKPTATSHWDRAMLVARKADLTKAVQNYIKLRGG